MKRNNKFLVLLLLITLFILVVSVSLKIRIKTNKDAAPQQNSDGQLIGKWEVVSVRENVTEIVFEENNAIIIFSANGTCSATGGCNEMTNCRYEILSNSKLSMTVGGTKRVCSQDVVEYWDLNKVTNYEYVNDNLLLHYEKENGVNGFFELRELTQ